MEPLRYNQTSLTSQQSQTPVIFLFHMSLPQNDTCDRKHAVWPNLSRLVQGIKHRKSHNSRPSTHSHIDSDVILIQIQRRGNAKNKILHFESVPATEPILSFFDE